MKIKHFYLLVFLIFAGNNIYSLDFVPENWAYGINLNTSFAELRYSQKETKQNYGLSVFTQSFWKNFPCAFKIGKISSGGAFSFLKNPEFSSSITPFSLTKTNADVVTGNLCSLNSFPENYSIFLQLGLKNSKNVFNEISFNCFWTPEEQTVEFSGFCKFVPLKKMNFTYSFSGAFLPYESSNYSSWFNSNSVFFHSGDLFCFANELGASSKTFTSLNLLATYFSPSGKINGVYRSENKLQVKSFIFTLSAFYNPTESLFVASETFLQSLFQFKTGIQYKFVVKKRIPLFIKTGTSCYVNLNLADTSHTVKTVSGFQINNLYTTINVASFTTFKINSDNQIKTFFDSEKISFSEKWNLSNSSLNINCSWTFSPEENYFEFSQKYGVNYTIGQKSKLILTGSFSNCLKNGTKTSSSVSSGVNIMWKIKFLTVNGKISWVFDL